MMYQNEYVEQATRVVYIKTTGESNSELGIRGWGLNNIIMIRMN